MDLLFSYEQERAVPKKVNGEFKLLADIKRIDNFLYFHILYNFDYNQLKTMKIEHHLELNMNNGDFIVKYFFNHTGISDDKNFRKIENKSKNNFAKLFDLIENGFNRGEKRESFWGIKFVNAKKTINKLFFDQISPNFKNDFFKNKDYDNDVSLHYLFDLIVDFHLNKRGIKGHNNVYVDIQTEFPNKKWLEKNDHKFLPAVLDSYNLKSKFLIKELNENRDKLINIKSLNYLCKLFGNNYFDYLKKINWKLHCYDLPPNKKIHELKNEREKNFLVMTINNWEKNIEKKDSLIYSLNKLFSVRELLEQNGIIVKYTAKNDDDFENLFGLWNGHKEHLNRGYKIRYSLPEDVIKNIESEICVNGLTFKPKLLLSEDDYRMEGIIMKNCMGKQFINGVIYLYVSLKCDKKIIFVAIDLS